MLFNSYEFIFAFLPVCLTLYFIIGAKLPKLAVPFLVIASLIFYSYWDIRYLPLLLLSIISNYLFGLLIEKYKSKMYLILGICFNFALLIYFKYTFFIAANFNELFNTAFKIPNIILPLGISFFTFTQTAFLVDAYRGETKQYNFSTYCLFVTIFPHLIAGPILHHREMVPQFLNPKNLTINWNNIWLGTVIFIVGLAKKVLIADHLALFANPIFSLAGSGAEPAFIESWIASLSYSMQLYFDFSGYSEMAIGLALLFNFKIPVNFFSPYKAKNIIEFWRRWHISLSNYLRDYLYIPLGGNRRGESRRIINLLTTMLLGGLWHGAGWNFVVWGGLHGAYLTINHMWQSLWHKKFAPQPKWNFYKSTASILSHMLTFVSVVIAWVFFRAENIETAMRIVKGMFGINGISVRQDIAAKLETINWLHLSPDGFLPLSSIPLGKVTLSLTVALAIAFCLPNMFELLSKYNPALGLGTYSGIKVNEKYSKLLLHPISAVILGMLAGISILGLSKVSEFLYFQF